MIPCGCIICACRWSGRWHHRPHCMHRGHETVIDPMWLPHCMRMQEAAGATKESLHAQRAAARKAGQRRSQRGVPSRQEPGKWACKQRRALFSHPVVRKQGKASMQPQGDQHAGAAPRALFSHSNSAHMERNWTSGQEAGEM